MRNVRPGLACVLGLVCGVAPAPAIAHETAAPHSIAVGVLVGARSARDDILVPIASTGPELALQASFLGSLHRSIVATELRAGMGALFDRDLRPAAALDYRISAGYLRVVVDAPDRWSAAVGPVLVWSSDVAWFAKWDDAHAYWMGRRWAGVSARAWRRLSLRWRLDLAAECSLLGAESRPPAYRANKEDALTRPVFYLADVNRDARFAWLGTSQDVRITLDAHRFRSWGRVPSGWGFGVEARVAHTDRPTMAFVLETSFRIAHAWEVR